MRALAVYPRNPRYRLYWSIPAIGQINRPQSLHAVYEGLTGTFRHSVLRMTLARTDHDGVL
jgi:hypothetical protein